MVGMVTFPINLVWSFVEIGRGRNGLALFYIAGPLAGAVVMVWVSRWGKAPQLIRRLALLVAIAALVSPNARLIWLLH